MYERCRLQPGEQVAAGERFHCGVMRRRGPTNRPAHECQHHVCLIRKGILIIDVLLVLLFIVFYVRGEKILIIEYLTITYRYLK